MKSELRAWHPGFAVRITAILHLCLAVPVIVGGAEAQMKDSPQLQVSKQPLGQISGHVYRSDTGEPIPKAEVSLNPQDESTSKLAGGSRAVRTTADGRFCVFRCSSRNLCARCLAEWVRELLLPEKSGLQTAFFPRRTKTGKHRAAFDSGWSYCGAGVR